MALPAQSEKGDDVTWPDHLNQKKGRMPHGLTSSIRKGGWCHIALPAQTEKGEDVTWPNQLNQKRGRMSHGLTSSIRKGGGCHMA